MISLQILNLHGKANVFLVYHVFVMFLVYTLRAKVIEVVIFKYSESSKVRFYTIPITMQL